MSVGICSVKEIISIEMAVHNEMFIEILFLHINRALKPGDQIEINGHIIIWLSFEKSNTISTDI
jgi:hypothetical protein